MRSGHVVIKIINFTSNPHGALPGGSRTQATQTPLFLPLVGCLTDVMARNLRGERAKAVPSQNKNLPWTWLSRDLRGGRLEAGNVRPRRD